MWISLLKIEAQSGSWHVKMVHLVVLVGRPNTLGTAPSDRVINHLPMSLP